MADSRTYPFSTPYTAVLHTNFVPLEAECLRIRDLVVAPIVELEKTTQEIAHLKAKLEQLASKQVELTEFIDAHLALVSGARRLPDDILREIFIASSDGNAIISPAEAPMLITHICSEWRSLALSMPRLWASLDIKVLRRFRRSGTATNREDAVNCWLARSGDLPLSISYEANEKMSISSPIFEVFMDYSHRWKHIRFILQTIESYEPLQDLTPEEVPILETVVMSPTDHGGIDAEVAANHLAFLRTSSIRRVSLRISPSTSSALWAVIAWDNLRDLYLHCHLSYMQALDLSRQCRNLEIWVACISDNDAEVSLNRDPIHMEPLRQLCLVDGTGNGGTRFLDHAVLPNLQCLEYSKERGHVDTKRVLGSLLASEKLTHLGLSAQISADDLAENLRLFPALESLILHRPRTSLQNNNVFSCEVFALLTPPSPNSTATLCPQLREIRILGLNAGSDEELVALIQGRCPEAAELHSLSKVDIAFPRKQMDIMGELAVLGARVDMTLRYTTDEQLHFIGSKRFRVLQPHSLMSTIGRAMQRRREQQAKAERHPDNDWGPISRRWVADYAQWGPDLTRRIDPASHVDDSEYSDSDSSEGS
ncbi:hypothetical protein B0H11DRAFT_2113009 [Mycena galericulata]|nr:hypothetical protein B0H11DRAFT_2113009 [Mycena galericulata]